MSGDSESVRTDYLSARTAMLVRLGEMLQRATADSRRLTYEDLLPFDQMHNDGVAASRDHIARAGIPAGAHVLDLGCGVGGVSRLIAGACGCRVTGVDLNPAFVDMARRLTDACGLADRVDYAVGDALSLPFGNVTFDHVYCHNVTMNIADKSGFLAEVARVLKPGGRYSCWGIAQGPGGSPYFPLPWALAPSTSFLETPEVACATLVAGGFAIIDALTMPASPVPGSALQDTQDPRYAAQARSIAESRLVTHFVLAAKRT